MPPSARHSILRLLLGTMLVLFATLAVASDSPAFDLDKLSRQAASWIGLSKNEAKEGAPNRIELEDYDIIIGTHDYSLSGIFDVDLSPSFEESLKKGLSFTFIQRFELERPRAYWFAEIVTVQQRSRQLSYNALLRQYQIETVGQLRGYDTLAAALRALGDLSGWSVLPKNGLSKGPGYRARIRMYLDASQLPKPLQLNTFASERWDIDSGWTEWVFHL